MKRGNEVATLPLRLRAQSRCDFATVKLAFADERSAKATGDLEGKLIGIVQHREHGGYLKEKKAATWSSCQKA